MIDTKFSLPMPKAIEEITAIVERDIPKALWMVGKCDCPLKETHVAFIRYPGEPIKGVTFISIGPDGITGGPVAVGDWQVDAHGDTPIEALTNCYVLAMEKSA